MPLPREVAYWEEVSKHCVGGGTLLKDNVWKRPEQLKRLLAYNWLNQKVLEIGVGNGVIAGLLRVSVQGHWDYIGTELSANFRDAAGESFQLLTVEADVKELPGNGYTRIIALDSLEHVRPDDRPDGYAKIASVAAKDALLFIHFSQSISYHDKEFDHPFGLDDLRALEVVGFKLKTYEAYPCQLPNQVCNYVFVMMQK